MEAIAPNIIGMDTEKQAAAVQLFAEFVHVADKSGQPPVEVFRKLADFLRVLRQRQLAPAIGHCFQQSNETGWWCVRHWR